MALRPTVCYLGSDPTCLASVREVAGLLLAQVHPFASGQAFLEARLSIPHGCLVAELVLADMTAIQLQETLGRADRRLPFILLLPQPATHLTVRAMRNGAVTVLDLPVSQPALSEAIESALARHARQCQLDAQLASTRRRFETLTTAEKDVLMLILTGITNKATAERLGVSLRTVEARRRHILEKTGTHSVAELAQLAASLRYVQEPTRL